VHLLRGDYGASEIKSVIGECDFMIASRMHACIAALSQGIASVGLAYSRKFAGVFESIGIGEMVVDARAMEMEELTAECVRRFEDRRRVALVLARRIPEVQSELRRCFREEILAPVIEAAARSVVDEGSDAPVARLAGEGR
jgi:polysaccharide pyruvyl transferase WcaK-like protein